MPSAKCNQRVGVVQNPVILLCDEATSALDSRTEKQILQALQTLAHGRTSLFVAHRLSTAAQCDQIVVLEGVKRCVCLSVLLASKLLHSACCYQELIGIKSMLLTLPCSKF